MHHLTNRPFTFLFKIKSLFNASSFEYRPRRRFARRRSFSILVQPDLGCVFNLESFRFLHFASFVFKESPANNESHLTHFQLFWLLFTVSLSIVAFVVIATHLYQPDLHFHADPSSSCSAPGRIELHSKPGHIRPSLKWAVTFSRLSLSLFHLLILFVVVHLFRVYLSLFSFESFVSFRILLVRFLL